MVPSRYRDYRYEWPDHIVEPTRYNCRIEALIPNLKHRPERWTQCRELLEKQGFPRARIHRFNAFSWKDYATAAEAVEHARESIRPMPRLISESRFIAQNNVSELCWLLTWYSIIFTHFAAHEAESVLFCAGRRLFYSFQLCAASSDPCTLRRATKITSRASCKSHAIIAYWYNERLCRISISCSTDCVAERMRVIC